MNVNGLTVTRTTYTPYGSEEPCIIVANDYDVKVRIAPYYHLIGDDTVIISRFYEDNLEEQDELKYSFESITDDDAVRLAREFCVYL